MPAFDPNVFDSGTFDAAYVTPLLRNVIIEPEFRVVAAGQHVPIKVHIMQADTTYGKRYDLNPEQGVQVEIHNPDGTIKQAFADMSVMTTGRFIYTYITAIGDQQGYYSARFKAVNGSKVMISRRMGIFDLLTQDVLDVADGLVFDPAVFDALEGLFTPTPPVDLVLFDPQVFGDAFDTV